jgi:uncharacterized protein
MTEGSDTTEAAEPDQPVASGERMVTLDFIRGIAVLGILFPNIVALSNPTLAYFWPHALPGGATELDKLTSAAQLVLIDGKFRGLFTLLFGAGMMLFIERAWARGRTRWLQARRLLWLGLFGLAHFYLLWTGDILFMYAIAGLIALPMLTWTARTQLRVGLIWYLAGALFFSVILGGQAAMENVPGIQQQAPQAYADVREGVADMTAKSQREKQVMSDGSYGDVVGYRVREEGSMYFETLFFALVETVPLMLIGMAVYGMGLFERRMDTAKMQRWGWIGLIGGALATVPIALLVYAQDFPVMLTQAALAGPSSFFHLPMVLGLAALLSLWASSATQTWLGTRFAAAGRMAFSNYIGCSAVSMLVFQGWAGGLYAQYHRIDLFAFVVLMWLLMLVWSKWWLDRFDYGPLEWLWRCLTYWHWFPLRKQAHA